MTSNKYVNLPSEFAILLAFTLFLKIDSSIIFINSWDSLGWKSFNGDLPSFYVISEENHQRSEQLTQLISTDSNLS